MAENGILARDKMPLSAFQKPFLAHFLVRVVLADFVLPT
jgi:hypothetical protein